MLQLFLTLQEHLSQGRPKRKQGGTVKVTITKITIYPENSIADDPALAAG